MRLPERGGGAELAERRRVVRPRLDEIAQTRRAYSANAAGLRAESGKMHGSSARSRPRRGRLDGAGASSACALAPPKPKEFTATSGVRPCAAGSGVSRVGMRIAIQRQQRVRRLEVKIRRDRAVLEHEHGLDESRQSGRRLEVADVGLHRTDQQPLVGRAPVRQARPPARGLRSDRRPACPSRAPPRRRRRCGVADALCNASRIIASCAC